MVYTTVLKRLKQNSTNSFPKPGRPKQRQLKRKNICRDAKAIAKENNTENKCGNSCDKENLTTHSNKEQPKYTQKKFIDNSEPLSDCNQEEIQANTLVEVRQHTPQYNTDNSTEEIKNDQNTVTMPECQDIPVHFECTLCNRQYSSDYNLKRHKLIHRAEKPFRCSICGKSFNIRYALFDHRLNAHTGFKICTCPVCNKSFSKRQSLAYHMNVHSDSPNYKCLHCNETFLSRYLIRYHMQKSHNEGLALGTNHVKLTNRSITVENQQEKNDKPCVCDICGYCTKSFSNLQRHMYSHFGDRPLKCIFCNKDFLALKRLRIHTLSKHNVDIGDLVQVDSVVFKSKLKDRCSTLSVEENEVDNNVGERQNKHAASERHHEDDNTLFVVPQNVCYENHDFIKGDTNTVATDSKYCTGEYNSLQTIENRFCSEEVICKPGPNQKHQEMLDDEKDIQNTVSTGQTNRSVMLNLFGMLQRRLDENNQMLWEIKNVENENEVNKAQNNEFDEMHSQILECNSLLFERGSECIESLDTALVQVNTALESNIACNTNRIEHAFQSKMTENLNNVSNKETFNDQIQNTFSERQQKRKFSNIFNENDENTCSSEFLNQENETVVRKKSKRIAILTETKCDPNETIIQNKLRESDTIVKCAACGDVFKSQRSLTTHIYIVHTGYKPYQCDICGKYFSVKKNRKNHRKTHFKSK